MATTDFVSKGVSYTEASEVRAGETQTRRYSTLRIDVVVPFIGTMHISARYKADKLYHIAGSLKFPEDQKGERHDLWLADVLEYGDALPLHGKNAPLRRLVSMSVPDKHRYSKMVPSTWKPTPLDATTRMSAMTAVAHLMSDSLVRHNITTRQAALRWKSAYDRIGDDVEHNVRIRLCEEHIGKHNAFMMHTRAILGRPRSTDAQLVNNNNNKALPLSEFIVAQTSKLQRFCLAFRCPPPNPVPAQCRPSPSPPRPPQPVAPSVQCGTRLLDPCVQQHRLPSPSHTEPHHKEQEQAKYIWHPEPSVNDGGRRDKDKQKSAPEKRPNKNSKKTSASSGEKRAQNEKQETPKRLRTDQLLRLDDDGGTDLASPFTPSPQRLPHASSTGSFSPFGVPFTAGRLTTQAYARIRTNEAK